MNNFMSLSSIFSAAVHGDMELICSFISGGSVNIQNDSGNTMLHLALANQCKELITFLLEKNACIEIENNIGEYPLHYGAMFFGEPILNKLISPVTINAFSKRCETPLHLAVKYFNTEGVIYLLSRGANVNALQWNYTFLTQTPLHYAVDNNDLKMAELLLENGADPNKYNNEGLQPYYYAGWRKHYDMTDLLEKYGSKAYPL